MASVRLTSDVFRAGREHRSSRRARHQQGLHVAEVLTTSSMSACDDVTDCVGVAQTLLLMRSGQAHAVIHLSEAASHEARLRRGVGFAASLRARQNHALHKA